jgi:hypothetical protein
VDPTQNILQRLKNVRRSSDGWVALCPAHDDRNASLSIAAADNGGVVIKCHAGCRVEDICNSMGILLADLMPPRDSQAAPAKQIVATYDYVDESGRLLFQVVRYAPKDFRQRRRAANGEWDWSVKGVRVVPYRLPQLLAEPTRPVVIVEGEKDVENLAKHEVLATCNAGGALKWTNEHASFLRGREVSILPDNDDTGRKHARQVALTLDGVAASIRIVELPGLPEKGDVSDWLAAFG